MLYCLLFLPTALAVYSDWCEDNKDAKECCASDNTDCEDTYKCTCPGNLNTIYLAIAIAAAVLCVCMCLFVMFTHYFRHKKRKAVKAEDAEDEDTEQEQKPLIF